MMALTAKQFQSVMDVVKKWYDQGFRDRRVYGQLALPYDFDRITYVLNAGALCSPEGSRIGIM